jgi:6-phosphofructokinase 1
MRIGILTGGGDVPGLNPAIRAVVLRAAAAGHEVVGLRRGWAALVTTDPSDPATVAANTVALDPLAVRTVGRTGGTFLHSSRTNPSKVKAPDVPAFLADRVSGDGPFDLTDHAISVLEHLGIDVLVPIGGDDTLSYSLRLHDEGVPVVAIPKTMDNDVSGTDYCLGFSTAVTRCVEFITNLRTATGSHERIAVIELFGRYSGQTSLLSGYLAGVDRVVISEVPVDVERLAGLLMEDKAANPSNYAMVTVSEGATLLGGDLALSGEEDAFGHRKLGGIGQELGDRIKALTGEGIINQNVAYLMRSGAPDALDTMVATNYGTLAADLVLSGSSGLMVALRGGAYTSVSIAETRAGARTVDVDAFYDVEHYRPLIREVAGKPMFLY